MSLLLSEVDTFLYGGNSSYILNEYIKFLENKENVSADWRDFFIQFQDKLEPVLADYQKSFQRKNTLLGKEPENQKPTEACFANEEKVRHSINALRMIHAYRVRGHLAASLDPLKLEEREAHPELDPKTYGFSEADMGTVVFLDGTLGLQSAPLRDILTILRKTYCDQLAVEFMHSQHPEHKSWIQERIERYVAHKVLSKEERLETLNLILQAETFEQFLNTKQTGAKKFGLDGSEGFIVGLYEAIRTSASLDVNEVIMGMAHRGRLNVLSTIMGKSLVTLFSEFRGTITHPDDVSSGDVKYHLGFSSDKIFDGKKVHLSLNANPSHLEAIDPVVLGKTRAKQAIHHDKQRKHIMGLLIHGDAAFIGQGIVAECLALSDLDGYRTGGTLHMVINNQIGFTTDPTYSRSSPYCSDIAKSIQAPIFHVNGDDPDNVVFISRLAAQFRHTFQKDVVVDIVGYRRYGHNESDDPSFTQPRKYTVIAKHPSVLTIYSKRLIEERLLTTDEFSQLQKQRNDKLLDAYDAAMNTHKVEADWLKGSWIGLGAATGIEKPIVSNIPIKELKRLGLRLIDIPPGFGNHKRLPRLLKAKEEMIMSGQNIDWSTAEALAFATLLVAQIRVRLSGQDSGRGTFSQRHCVWVDQKTQERYVPLNHLQENQAPIEILDSPLSELAVLGFEYGYSTADPRSLVIWEAQFGDFANGAQMIFDQFLSAAESKWLRMSGLVVLLPHGYEGQGPEHSSARPERYLQLCADYNMCVVNCTTPANYFHVLRRQLLRSYRKPLVVFTPKSLLRHKKAVSSLKDMATGSTFLPVIADATSKSNPSKVKRIVFTFGKIYYDLEQRREETKKMDVALIRIEEMYPFPAEDIVRAIAGYPKSATIIWCQEEPQNMGAWLFVDRRLEKVLSTDKWQNPRPEFIGRRESASPATGFLKQHLQEQETIVIKALDLNPSERTKSWK